MILAANGNVLVAVIITVAFLATLVQLLLVTYLMTSRCTFAWAFDRIAPTWLADVSERRGTPVKAILLVLGLGVIYMAAYSWAPPWFYILIWTASYFPQIIITFLFTGVAAIVYSTSKKWKESYDTSPAKSYQIAGIPLMAIMGAFSIITMLVFAGIYLTNPSYGVTMSFGIPYSIAIIAVPIIYFYAIRAYRNKQGMNIDSAFKAIPPE
jgi:basic amino acid/polyamine antiporter, APA family